MEPRKTKLSPSDVILRYMLSTDPRQSRRKLAWEIMALSSEEHLDMAVMCAVAMRLSPKACAFSWTP